MNKRITSIVLSLAMLFTMLATAVPVLAATPVELKVTADTTSANPGDTINYKVSVGAVTDMGGLEFKLDIPSGLTVVDGSISIPDGLETIIDSDGPIIVPTSSNSYYWLYSAQLTGYTGTSDLVILTFSCKVDDGITGTKTVSIKEVVLIDQSVEDMPFNVTGADVNVTIPHAHVYDQTSTDAAHLKTPATCTEAAVYYKSCTCGENGTETFTSGSVLGHDYTKKVENNTYLKTAASNCTEYNVYWYACSRCDANAKDDAEATDKYYTSTTVGNHSFTEKIEDAAHYVAGTGTNCQSVKKYYFDCAYCDQIGTTTWDSTTYGEHSYATVWSRDASGHWHECSLCHDKKDEAAHTPDHTGHATEEYAIKCTECDYVIEAQLAPRTPVTNIAATVTSPALGQKPDYAPVIVANPADSIDLEEVCWYKIAAADFTGTDEDDWVEMASDETFTTGYYYSVDMYFNPNDGYKMSESATGTVNGMPHDDTYGELYEGDSAAYLCGLFEPLAVEYTIDLPFSLAVKLTGDEKPAKETFKFEIHDLGCEDAEFEILNDSITAENIAFDENGVAFIEGSLKIKVTGEDQLCNLTEGFSVRMVKGSTKGWTYASEQWRIELFFENDALDFGIAVKEIVDGEISEVYANGMSFAVSYEAVSEPDPTDPTPENPDSPQTGDNSMMGLWIALLFVSGAGVVGTTIYSRKKKYSVK